MVLLRVCARVCACAFVHLRVVRTYPNCSLCRLWVHLSRNWTQALTTEFPCFCCVRPLKRTLLWPGLSLFPCPLPGRCLQTCSMCVFNFWAGDSGIQQPNVMLSLHQARILSLPALVYQWWIATRRRVGWKRGWHVHDFFFFCTLF